MFCEVDLLTASIITKQHCTSSMEVVGRHTNGVILNGHFFGHNTVFHGDQQQVATPGLTEVTISVGQVSVHEHQGVSIVLHLILDSCIEDGEHCIRAPRVRW